MDATKGLAKTGGTFIKDQHDAIIACQLAYFIEEIIFWFFVADDFHLDRSKVIVFYQCLKLINTIIFKWPDRIPQ